MKRFYGFYAFRAIAISTCMIFGQAQGMDNPEPSDIFGAGSSLQYNTLSQPDLDILSKTSRPGQPSIISLPPEPSNEGIVHLYSESKRVSEKPEVLNTATEEAIRNKNAEYFKENPKILKSTLYHYLYHAPSDAETKKSAISFLKFMHRFNNCNPSCKSVIGSVIKEIERGNDVAKRSNLILNNYDRTQFPLPKITLPSDAPSTEKSIAPSHQSPASEETELTQKISTLKFTVASLNKTISSLLLPGTDKDSAIAKIKERVAEVVELIKSLDPGHGSIRTQALNNIVNEITEKPATQSDIVTWQIRTRDILNETIMIATLPLEGTMFGSQIGLERRTALWQNNWLQTSDEQLAYLNNKNWNHEVKTYILQLLWFNAQYAQDVASKKKFEKALKDLKEQTPSIFHTTKDIIIPNFTYRPHIPQDADPEVEKIDRKRNYINTKKPAKNA